MTDSQEGLRRRIQGLSNEALTEMASSGTLTLLAQEIALNEMESRGLQSSLNLLPDLDDVISTPSQTQEVLINGDLTQVASHLTWIEAQLLQSILQSENIPCALKDAHLSTANAFLSFANGGVRVLVHEQNRGRALDVIARMRQGEYQLDDDFDPEREKES